MIFIQKNKKTKTEKLQFYIFVFPVIKTFMQKQDVVFILSKKIFHCGQSINIELYVFNEASYFNT